MSPVRGGPGSRAARVGTGVTAAAVAAALGLMLLGGGADLPRFTGIEDLPLPGGADLGDHPYEVTAEFGDVLSLVPQSAVKVNDVTVGKVTDISLSGKGWTAEVTMRVNGDVQLPRKPYARIEQSSLLGEKYVQLLAPPEEKEKDTASPSAARPAAAHGPGRDTRIPLSRTNRNPEVEEVLGALSMLLNGRRRQPAQDHHHRAEQGPGRQRGGGQIRARPRGQAGGEPRPAQGRHHPGPGRRQPALRDPRRPEEEHRHRADRRQPGTDHPGGPAGPAHDDAPLPRHPLRGRRGHRRPQQGRHRRRPQGPRAHSAAARRLRPGPARLPPGAVHVSVHRRGAARRQGRLPQPVPERGGAARTPR